MDDFIKRNSKQFLIGGIFLFTYTPTLLWMWDRWFAPGSYYAHGILVPFVTGYLIWQDKENLAKIKPQESPWGMPLIIVGITIHIFSALFRVYFSSGFSMIIVLLGLILYFYGKGILSRIFFPICFLVFMTPLPEIAVVTISFKMKVFAAHLATIILNHMRMPALCDGSIIKLRSAYVVVDDVCSGLRSLISLTALGTIFAYWMKGPRWKRGVVFLSTIPIAVITNVFRIIFLASVSEIWGPRYVTQLLHDFTGLLVFALAYVLLFIVARIIE